MAERELTPKQLKFADLLIAGTNQSDAYRLAYNAEGMNTDTLNNEAYLLSMHPEISKRVQTEREQALKAAKYGLAQAMDEAEQAFILAAVKGNPGAMVAATQLRARLKGLMVDNQKNRRTYEDMTDAELQQIIDRHVAPPDVTSH